MANQVQRTMNLFSGSVLATLSLTVPTVTLMLCQVSFSTGRTNILNGAAHLALFVAYLMTLFL